MRRFNIVWLWLGFQSVAVGQLDVGSDGSDGALNPSGTGLVVDLGEAESLCDCDSGGVANDPCRWDCPSPISGEGVYDAEKWAVVFKYSSVNISSGKSIQFKNHPSGAPVVWLVQGDVTIDGAVFLNAELWPDAGQQRSGGPGGFRGGRASLSDGSGGRGPGGGHHTPSGQYAGGSHASFGTIKNGAPTPPTYGSDYVQPLIGGSGASAYPGVAGWNGGGSGGGAILIAAGDTLTISGNGVIYSLGSFYGSGGSGGAVRLVASQITGTGAILAAGGVGGSGSLPAPGGLGRIRLEALNTITGGLTLVGLSTQSSISNPPQIWPPSDAPSLSVVSVGYTDLGGQPQTVPVPSDPRARFDFPNADVPMLTDQSITLNIAASNVPLNWVVTARFVPKSGVPIIVTASPLSGTLESSTTTAVVAIPEGFSAVQLRAAQP